MSEGKSVLIAVDDGEQIRAFGYDAGDAVRIELVDPYVGTYPLELTAFSYRATLDAFGLRAGEIAQTGNGIPIPAGELERSVVRGDMVEDWIPIEELGDRLAAVRLESSLTDPVQCLDRGRCFDLEGAGPDACVECPAPPMPADPIAPNDPDLSRCTWTVIAQMGTRVCAPWESRPSCDAGEIALPAEGCARVGPACPAGRFAEQIEGEVVYAAPGGPRGDGSEANPFSSIADAVLLAAPGSTIALARGTFEETVVVPEQVTLLGACSETVIRGANARQGSRLADLTIDGTLEVEGDASATGAIVRGDVIVRAALLFSGGRIMGDALVESGRLELMRSEAERVVSAAELTLGDATLNGNLKAVEGATVEARRTVIDGAIRFEGGDGLLEQVLVENSTSAPGITVRLGSQVIVDRSWFRSNVEADVLVRGIGTVATISDSILSDASGHGLQVLASASVTMRRSIVERTSGSAVWVEEPGSAIELTDVAIRDVTKRANGVSSDGVHLEMMTSHSLTRVRLERIAGKAIDADGSSGAIEDVSIDATGSGDCHQCTGLCAFSIAEVIVERLLATNTTGRALSCRGSGCAIDARNVQLIDTGPSSPTCVLENPNSTPRLGQAATAAEGGSLEISIFSITGAQGAGVALEEFDPESFGTALLVSDGEIADNASGAHLQVPEYPIARVANRVVYRNNRVNVVR